MSKLHRLRLKFEIFVVKHPKLIVPTVFVVFLGLISVFEFTRAHTYLNQVEDYKNSAKVLSLTDNVDRLSRAASFTSDEAAYCSLSLQGLIGNVNEAYEQDDANSPEALLRTIHWQAEEAGPSPAYNSLLQFLPRVREARLASEELHTALENIKHLTSEDSRSSYCTSLVDVLSEVYFINDIRTLQGVSALSVGQLENFQVNVNQAQDILKTLSYPGEFLNEHTAINRSLNDLRLHLQEDANNYEAFSRNIDSEYENILGILSDIEKKSADLLSLPEQIALYASTLN